MDEPTARRILGELVREDAWERAWLAEQQAERARQAQAACEARGAHTLASDATACPDCGTPYSEVFGDA